MNLLDLPESAAEQLRRRFDLGADKLRISYYCGPGDVLGTFRYWQQGRHDPRLPIVTYSAMFYELVRHLDAQAQIVTSACPDFDSGSGLWFSAVQRKPWTSTADYIRSQKAIVRDTAARIAEFDPHIVVVSTDFPPAGWPRLARGRRLIVSAHNSFWPMGERPSTLKGKIRQFRLSSHARSIDGAVCVSAECSRQIETLTRGRVHGPVAVPQIVNSYGNRSRAGVRNLLFLGRIEASKGVFMLLDAFLSLKDRHEQLHLSYAGSGSKDAELRTRVAAAGTRDVHILGQLDSQTVHRQIDEADLIVCPTTRGFNEGLATVGLEAAAHGVPTLLSSVVPAQDMLGAGCMVFEADNMKALEHSLERLVSEDAVYKNLVKGLETIQAKLHDRSQSWGTQLGRVLLSL